MKCVLLSGDKYDTSNISCVKSQVFYVATVTYLNVTEILTSTEHDGS